MSRYLPRSLLTRAPLSKSAYHGLYLSSSSSSFSSSTRRYAIDDCGDSRHTIANLCFSSFSNLSFILSRKKHQPYYHNHHHTVGARAAISGFSTLSSALFSSMDEKYMKMALKEAEKAAQLGEVPIGAIVVSSDGKTVLSRAHNASLSLKDVTKHAEIIALQQARERKNHEESNDPIIIPRLDGCILFVTIEPCLMCLGACMLHHVSRVVYASVSPKFGAVSGGAIRERKGDGNNDDDDNDDECTRSNHDDSQIDFKGIEYCTPSSASSVYSNRRGSQFVVWPAAPQVQTRTKPLSLMTREVESTNDKMRPPSGTTTINQHHSTATVNKNGGYNHRFRLEGGLYEKEAAEIMREFFLSRRQG